MILSQFHPCLILTTYILKIPVIVTLSLLSGPLKCALCTRIHQWSSLSRSSRHMHLLDFTVLTTLSDLYTSSSPFLCNTLTCSCTSSSFGINTLLIYFIFILHSSDTEKNGNVMGQNINYLTGFEKACDSWWKHYNILTEYGLPEELVRLIKTCLNGTYS